MDATQEITKGSFSKPKPIKVAWGGNCRWENGDSYGQLLMSSATEKSRENRTKNKEGYAVKGGLLFSVRFYSMPLNRCKWPGGERDTESTGRQRAETESGCRNVTGRSGPTPSSHVQGSKGRGDPRPHMAHGDGVVCWSEMPLVSTQGSLTWLCS